MKTWLLSGALLAVLTGCGSVPQQKVVPITLSNSEPHEICFVANPAVRGDFLEAYKEAVSNKGLRVKVISERAAVTACPLTTTYIANWRWDLAWYMAYANIKVYRNGRLEGEALYDSLQAGASTSKFVQAKAKIQELTDRLFPM